MIKSKDGDTASTWISGSALKEQEFIEAQKDSWYLAFI